MERISVYIESNPVEARLLDRLTKCRWLSANTSVETILDAADTSVRATLGQAKISLA